MKPTKGTFFSGTSNIVLPVTRAKFPEGFEDKSRLEYYAHLFNSLEVNSSFYKTPKAATVAKWADAVPANFNFTFKLSKAITHAKGLAFNEDHIEPFMQAIEPAIKRKGILLIQFPPSITIDKLDRLENLLKNIDWSNEANWPIGVEFRHVSWYEREVEEILKEYHAFTVLHDMPKSAPAIDSANGKIIYLRFHGPEGTYRGSYTDDVLKRYGKQIRKWLREDKDVYAYFNNTMGEAFANLQTLNAAVANLKQK